MGQGLPSLSAQGSGEPLLWTTLTPRTRAEDMWSLSPRKPGYIQFPGAALAGLGGDLGLALGICVYK